MNKNFHRHQMYYCVKMKLLFLDYNSSEEEQTRIGSYVWKLLFHSKANLTEDTLNDEWPKLQDRSKNISE